MGYLELNDLYKLAGVCKRFRDLARIVFSSKWKKLSFTVENMSDTITAIDYIRKFGPKIHSLRLKTTDDLPAVAYNILFNILVNYCGESLTHLELHGFAFKNSAIQEARPLIAHVKQLILHRCEITVKWFTMCPELIELTLKGTHVTYNGQKNQLCPKLKVLKIRGALTWVEHGLALFLQQNNQIKTFEVLCHPNINSNFDRYVRILDSVPSSIECLGITPLAMNKLKHFRSLKRLRIVDVNDVHNHISFQQMESTATLEHLEIELKYFDLNMLNANEISMLHNLKTIKLHIRYGCSNALLIQMVKNLKNLTELMLSTYPNMLNVKDLFDVIQHGENLERFGLSFMTRMTYNYTNETDDSDDEADDAVENDENNLHFKIYRKMVNIVSHRSNGKPLHIIFFGPQNEMVEFNKTFPMKSILKISYVSTQLIMQIMNIVDLFNGRSLQYIKMTDTVLRELRVRGLFS